MARQQVSNYEEELASYLQERIRPGLNRGAIPLLARSIAKEIAHRDDSNGAREDAEVDDEPTGEADDEPTGEEDDEPTGEEDDEPIGEADDEDAAEEDDEDAAEEDDEQSAESDPASAFEDEMHELQAELGDDWILRFSVQRDDAWLTAERDDGSQRVEAPTAEVLVQAVELLNEAGGRSS
jgi:hypothetical protein